MPQAASYSTLWVPSQNGLSSVLLHPQRLKVPEAFRDEAQGLEAGGLVGAVAERLLGGAPAGAPEIGFSGLERHLVGAFLRADGLVGHGYASLMQALRSRQGY